MQETQTKPIIWNLASIWNGAAIKENRPLQERDYIYASEIGMPFYDRYLKMKAIPFTNPPNNRSLRKFLAGNIWEHVTKQILVACGVYRHEEVKIDTAPYADCLWVHGRCDFIAGGYIDGEMAAIKVTNLNLPDYLVKVADKIIAELKGKTLAERIMELKAVSTFAMDKVERMGAAIPNHTMQAYHYQKNGNIQAAISYICKDDCRMAQFDVNAADTEPLYRGDLELMTYYYKNKKTPPFAPLSTFDTTVGKFSKNLGVEYSPYLSHYGFNTPDEYRESVSFIDKWNRCLSRYVQAEMGGTTPTGKPIVITSKNNDIKVEIEKAGYKMKGLIRCKIELGNISDEEED